MWSAHQAESSLIHGSVLDEFSILLRLLLGRHFLACSPKALLYLVGYCPPFFSAVQTSCVSPSTSGLKQHPVLHKAGGTASVLNLDAPCRTPYPGPLVRSFNPRLHKNLAGDIVVVKKAVNSEAATAVLADSACNLPGTLNSELFTSRIGRGNENLNSNVTSDRWATCAVNERSVESYIACKSTLRMLGAVIPVKDDGEVQLVSHNGPALRHELNGGYRVEFHK